MPVLSCRFAQSRILAGVVLMASTMRATPALATDSPDVVIADFEGDTYGGWTAEGSAFGPAPARGTLPGQMAVSGFLGRGLVNSFHQGDGSTGTLTSPPFRIERPFLNFLIGGGCHPGSTCLDLMIENKVVRTATGPNDRPGGTEGLDWASWNVKEFLGRTAKLRIVDRETGGWGHINVDQIVASDQSRGVEPARRELVASARYLLLPVREDAPVKRVRVWAGGRVVRDFDIKLAPRAPEYHVFLDVHPLEGQTLTIEAPLPSESKALALLSLSPDVPDAGRLYHEPGRPQFHFTSRRGWLNDPNGLVWHDGEYHLFYQHNPFGWDWGNMHWGHAVSRDLVRWTELPIALYPREHGDWAFSGSAVVDSGNTSGFGKNGAPPLVAAFTSTGRGECIIYSNDRGRTWTEYSGNPVVKHAGRDPRLLWHEPTKRWVMAVYDETGGAQAIALYSSEDLKTWAPESRVEGYFECPELFELPVAGDSGRKLWVLYAADGEYQLGRFDGHRFAPETGKQRVWYGNFYASQTFSNTPDQRRIQIGWARGITFPGEAFNQQMTVPCELTLRSTTEGVRLCARPAGELESLRQQELVVEGLTLKSGEDEQAVPEGDLLEITVEAEVGDAGAFTVNYRGTPVGYRADKKTLTCGDISAPLAPEGRLVRLRMLFDRGSIEVFGNDGRVAISAALKTGDSKPQLFVTRPAASPPVTFRSMRIHTLASAWR
jgi:fructan beta-fructosidase